jgi:hypothetical protein
MGPKPRRPYGIRKELCGLLRRSTSPWTSICYTQKETINNCSILPLWPRPGSPNLKYSLYTLVDWATTISGLCRLDVNNEATAYCELKTNHVLLILSKKRNSCRTEMLTCYVHFVKDNNSAIQIRCEYFHTSILFFLMADCRRPPSGICEGGLSKSAAEAQSDKTYIIALV